MEIFGKLGYFREWMLIGWIIFIIILFLINYNSEENFLKYIIRYTFIFIFMFIIELFLVGIYDIINPYILHFFSMFNIGYYSQHNFILFLKVGIIEELIKISTAIIVLYLNSLYLIKKVEKKSIKQYILQKNFNMKMFVIYFIFATIVFAILENMVKSFNLYELQAGLLGFDNIIGSIGRFILHLSFIGYGLFLYMIVYKLNNIKKYNLNISIKKVLTIFLGAFIMHGITDFVIYNYMGGLLGSSLFFIYLIIISLFTYLIILIYLIDMKFFLKNN